MRWCQHNVTHKVSATFLPGSFITNTLCVGYERPSSWESILLRGNKERLQCCDNKRDVRCGNIIATWFRLLGSVGPPKSDI